MSFSGDIAGVWQAWTKSPRRPGYSAGVGRQFPLGEFDDALRNLFPGEAAQLDCCASRTDAQLSTRLDSAELQRGGSSPHE